MSNNIESNKQFLTDLFSGPFRGHAILMDPVVESAPSIDGDVAVSDKPLKYFLDIQTRYYEARLKWHKETGDDSVPFASIMTGTEVFAAAFGAPVHCYEDSPPCALPIVSCPADADALPMPNLSSRPIERILQSAQLLRDTLGPDVPIGPPDIQSPFDIAALIWRKEDLFVSMIEDPESVKRLVGKCADLLSDFLIEYKRLIPNWTFVHCPYAWAPPELGCSMSEDEAGSLSTAMFDEFCLPVLTDFSEKFGGMFMHCCATADHQYSSFRKIPNLRGLNRVFQEPGAAPAIRAFSGETVLMMAWFDEATMSSFVDIAEPDTRFLFNMPGMPIDESKKTFERMRKICPRTD